MAIPRIIHQTYKTNDLPERLENYRKKLVDLHPGWEYRFYDDSECREAVRKYLPDFLPIYDRAPVIQKTDIFRVVVVYGQGGFYMDMDMECVGPLDPLCELRCVFGEELTLTEEEAERLGHRDRVRIANYMFGSEPGYPFLLHILRKIAEESQREIRREDDILESAGSGLVTTVYHNWKDKLRDLVLLPNIDRTCPVNGAVGCHFGNYGRHYHDGSWRFDKFGTKPFREKTGEEQIDKICAWIDRKIAAIDVPEDIYILGTFTDRPFDGLTTVYDRTAAIGTVVDDTRHLRNKKVLVCGMPAHYSDKLSGRNTNVVYTTFESDELPGFWLGAINDHYDHCIVPHHYIKDVFISSGVSIPIEVIHQGYTRHKRTSGIHLKRDVFRIGFLGVPYKRKNLFKLYQACVNLLGKIPGLRLAVHSAKLFKGMSTPEIAIMAGTSFVEWSDGTLSADETAEWYGELSCYVFPSSGEGWSFTPRESLYLGIPTILSDIPVHREIIESGFCKAIPVSGVEGADFEGNFYGRWDRVSVQDIEEAIWDVYQNYGSYLIRAMQGSLWIENRWTNESSQQRVLELMRKL